MTLEDLLPSLQGALPASIATSALDGTPNISFLSQLQYVDSSHLALPCQFFNKTRRNLVENPHATLVVLDPVTMRSHRLLVRFARSETEGPLFDEMSAQLEAMASLIGMKETLRLQSTEVFEVLQIERVEGDVVAEGSSGDAFDERRDAFQCVRLISKSLARAADLDALFRLLFESLAELGINHLLLLLADEASGRLFTIASHGYPEEGVGSEVRYGEGIIGTAAKARRPLRIGDIERGVQYARVVAGAAPDGAVEGIPLPGLKQPQSCLAIPLQWYGQLVGVLAAESETLDAFSEHHESLLGIIANQIAPAVSAMLHRADLGAPVANGAAPSGVQRGTRHFTFYRKDESIFVDGEYLIRYVPAQILWRLLQQHAAERRVDFTNRELRMDPAIRLPPLKDNLEARLLLLRKRLEQKCPDLRLRPTGRGRFRLEASCGVELVEKDTP